MADAVDLKRGRLIGFEWFHDHSQKARIRRQGRHADISGARMQRHWLPLQCVMLVIFDAQTPELR
jgi:hypothetical protein